MPFIFAILLIMFWPASGTAHTPPLPESKKEAIGSYAERLANEKAKSEELESKMQSLASELQATRERLVSVSRKVQSTESSLDKLEREIEELESEQNALQEKLNRDRHSIARLVLALERLRRVPPEALIARPGAPLKAAQTSMLLRDVIPAIHQQAQQLKTDLARLQTLTADVRDQKQRAEQTAADLRLEQEKLEDLAEKREKIYAASQSDLSERKAVVQRLSAEARSLRELVQKLEDRRRADRNKDTRKTLAAYVPVPQPGEARLPVSGIIRTRYDEPDNIGAQSQGLHIVGRGGSLVVAPMGGEVRYAGPFKRYGQIVIIEHKDGYHSLVAGLEKVDTVVGRTVSVGEPVGKLPPQAEADGRPVLYYELRKNGRPVDPARKFAEFG